jgi:carbon-monoxide dehydrogenase small subunit
MTVDISLEVNGTRVDGSVEPRLLLADFLRDEVGLTGTHLGCEHGVCGACTVQFDGAPVRSCLMFAVQADGHQIATVEGLAPSAEELHPIQQAFHEYHALQCGFCTPGILMTVEAFLRDHPDPTPGQVKTMLSGNLCRCTGYQNITTAVLEAAKRLREREGLPEPTTVGGRDDGH